MPDICGSNTLAADRDCWCTPKAVYDKLNREFNFVGDVAADHQNHLHHLYLTKEDNALEEDWHQYFLCGHGYGYVFCNPPYSNVMPWVEKANDEVIKGVGTVMLVNSDLSTKWFARALDRVSEIRVIIGRLSFVPHNKKQKPSGNSKGSMLLIWNPHNIGQGLTRYVTRESFINENKFWG